ncbi:MAG: hypothetical protein Q7J67_00530 [bacterium]|nr:hypothetical protein [bacterium]
MAVHNIDVTNIDLERDEGIACTKIAFTANDSGVADTLTIVPTRPGKKMVLIITTVTIAVNVTIALGNYWYAKALAAVNVPTNSAKAFCFTPARYQTSTGLKATSGKMVITVTPVDGVIDAVCYQVLQLPGVVGRLPSESES